MTPRKLSAAVAAVLTICLLLITNSTKAAFDAYLKIEGTKQGKFKGEGARSQSGQIPVLSFSYQPSSSRDQATGQASGKRMHETVKIMKQVDASSPQIMRAMTTGEVLSSVVLEFVHPGPDGKEVVYKTLQLMNAIVSAQRRVGGEGTMEREEVEFTFQKIEVSSDGGKTSMDDWLSRK